MKIELEISEDCEATSAPYWLILDPKQNLRTDREASHAIASMITGPFFSRNAAQHVLDTQRYNFGKGAVVYCCSGHNTTQYAEKVRF